MDRVQKCLPEILENETTKADFYSLPIGCLETIFSSDFTLISEITLYRSLENKILTVEKSSSQGSRKGSEVSSDSKVDIDSLRALLKTIRLHLISVKNLVSDVKLSGNFQDSDIFEAI